MNENSIVYIEIEREIDFYYQMKQNEMRFELQLNIEGITSARHQFELCNVHDLSHKPFSFGGGILYLHTNQGVFSYQIQDDPDSFMLAFQSLKAKTNPS
ncbi:hypothetical protein [Bacillus sp. FJAT-22090]|uniref:hypothetical protein n=1 Tax=Bacillus sp. FJAT-22090 TaxID=1581038 RepID=UPI0011A2E5DC|nr:hypothetical protein [Bacillus sp. FJAT-22090]